MVSEGVASVEDVDKALSAGPGLRWALMGQHMIYHLGGGSGGYEKFIDGIGASFGEYWKTMPTWSQIPDAVREAAISGLQDNLQGADEGDLVAWRDEKLVKILKILQHSASYTKNTKTK